MAGRQTANHTNSSSSSNDTRAAAADALLGHAEWAGRSWPGQFQPRPVIIRTHWPEARVLGSGTLVGHDGEARWILLTDFPLDPGLGLTVGQVMEELGTLMHFACMVHTCRAGQRPEDAGRDVFISRLDCRRADAQS